MAKKSALLGGRSVKVENRSSFDKSCLNLLTTGVGTITPIRKQLLIPSSGRCKIPVHVELPPLAADAYLRTHLKMEAFFVPLRLCYGGFQSWFCGEPIWVEATQSYSRASIPSAFIVRDTVDDGGVGELFNPDFLEDCFGPGTLTDYFDVRLSKVNGVFSVPSYDENQQELTQGFIHGLRVNLFPYICYHLIHDHFYRNKSVQRPAFMPPAFDTSGVPSNASNVAGHIPYLSFRWSPDVLLGSKVNVTSEGDPLADFASTHLFLYSDDLLNGHSLFELRQRNYGDDYFTSAKPTAQDGNPVQVQVDQNGRFTIAALRLQNALQEFAENQNYATPDFIQTNMARYGVAPSDGIAQKPILLGSADFPIFTKSVELNSAAAAGSTSRNPFINDSVVGAKAGNASGNGVFEFDFDVKEPGYLMVMATLVPEANYASGISRDMILFTRGSASLPDLPCSLLEHIGDEEIYSKELNSLSSQNHIFGFNQRYLWHKVGAANQIHGKFIAGEGLDAFSVQRSIIADSEISSGFLEVDKSDLDGVAAVSSGISEYGVMIDCAIELFVSEPLTESALPALVNPASEHGRSVYLKNGGSKLA